MEGARVGSAGGWMLSAVPLIISGAARPCWRTRGGLSGEALVYPLAPSRLLCRGIWGAVCRIHNIHRYPPRRSYDRSVMASRIVLHSELYYSSPWLCSRPLASCRPQPPSPSLAQTIQSITDTNSSASPLLSSLLTSLLCLSKPLSQTPRDSLSGPTAASGGGLPCGLFCCW